MCRQIGGSSAQQLTITISRMCTITISRVRVNHAFELLSFAKRSESFHLSAATDPLFLAAWIGAKQLRSPGAELPRYRSINYP